MSTAAPAAIDWRRPRHWPAALLCGACWLLAQLPLAVLSGSAVLLAPPVRLLARGRVRIIRTNLALCFPELDAPARERLLRANVRASVRGILEALAACFRQRRIGPARYRVEGLERIRAELNSGRGVLLQSAHFTPMLLCGRILAEALGQPIPTLARRHNNLAFEALTAAGHRRWAGELVEKKDTTRMVQLLRAGQPLFYAPDQNFNLHARFFPFFGHPAATLTASARLARAGRAQVLPVFLGRDLDGCYRVEVGAPLAQDAGGEDADTLAYLAWLEAMIRRAPQHYLWAHRRFKTRPQGESRVYE